MESTCALAKGFVDRKIKVREPFADYLLGTKSEVEFEISLLDAVHFAGHACPSVVGAFLIAMAATKELFSEDGVCIRGDLTIEMPAPATYGATGPMANVLSYITGAWGETGFGGLKGNFARRNLLKFSVEARPNAGIRFTRNSTGKSVTIVYRPSSVEVQEVPDEAFQMTWRRKINEILKNPNACLEISSGHQ